MARCQLGARNQNLNRQAQLAHGEIGVLQRRKANPDGEVQTFFDDIHAPVGRIEQNLNPRVLLDVPRDDRGHARVE
jgi:hypothetical protein